MHWDLKEESEILDQERRRAPQTEKRTGAVSVQVGGCVQGTVEEAGVSTECRKWVGVRPDRKIRAERKDPGEGLFSVVAAAGLFSGCGEQELLFVAVCGLLILLRSMG